MAGPYTPQIIFRNQNGVTVSRSCYFAGGDSAGAVIPIAEAGIATTASATSFTLPPGIWTVVYLGGGETGAHPATGRLRIWCNGAPGPVAWDQATMLAQVASNLTYGAFRGGEQWRYQIQVEASCEA